MEIHEKWTTGTAVSRQGGVRRLVCGARPPHAGRRGRDPVSPSEGGEFIAVLGLDLERPEQVNISKYYPMLAHYGSVTLSDCGAEVGSTWNGVGTGPHYFDIMRDPTNDDSEQEDAGPGPINLTNNVFSAPWYHYGDVDSVS